MWTVYLLNLNQSPHLIIHLLHCLLVRGRGRSGEGSARKSWSHPGLCGSTGGSLLLAVWVLEVKLSFSLLCQSAIIE